MKNRNLTLCEYKETWYTNVCRRNAKYDLTINGEYIGHRCSRHKNKK